MRLQLLTGDLARARSLLGEIRADAVPENGRPIALAAGRDCPESRVGGPDLVYGQETVWLPDLFICRPEYRDPALAELEHPRAGERT